MLRAQVLNLNEQNSLNYEIKKSFPDESVLFSLNKHVGDEAAFVVCVENCDQ